MIGTEPSEQQQVISRWIRIIGSGLIGVAGVLGLFACLVINITTPRRTSGCIVEYPPSLLGAATLLAMAGLVVALLAFARSTTAAMIGSVLFGAFSLATEDDFLAPYGFLMALAILVVAVTAKCVAEFPTQRPGSAPDPTDETTTTKG